MTLHNSSHVYFWLIYFGLSISLGLWKVCLLGLAVIIFTYFAFEYEPKIEKNDFKVCIVGAGFSGIGMGIRLKKLGVDFEIYEAGGELGGTWSQNVYPGCACDIQSHLYSFSFAPNPNWSEEFSGQEEILQYLKDVADQYDLKINYNAKVKEARWNAEKKSYRIAFHDGRTAIEANFLVYGAGALREPIKPNFKGMEDFKGASFHSAYWDKSVDLSGKRIGIIGTGASSVQIVPSICDDVEKLFVFQRTPSWCPPRINFSIPELVKFAYNHIPGILYAYRLWLFLIVESRYFTLFRTDSIIPSLTRKLMEKYIKFVVEDPHLAKLLTPDYTMGCKRMTPSDTYLKAFNCPKVQLITNSIDRITEKGIKTLDGNEYEVDVIVYAIGFSPLESFKNAFEIYNGEGIRLNDVMQDNPRAFLGVTFPKFPNYFLLLGPHTALGHNSVVWMIECSINHIVDVIRKMADSNIRAVCAKEKKLEQFQDLLQEYMKNKVFYEGCISWYRNQDGSGTNYTLWPSHVLHYWWITRTADLQDYECQ